MATDLPTELLLDILETLLVLRDKESRRSAAHLAQTCTALRTSEVGKRARYLHARAALSLSVPDKLPTNLDYEIEVLETSVWPHQPALEGPTDRIDDATSFLLSDGFLETNGHVALSIDRRGLYCFVDTSQASDLSALAHQHRASYLTKGSVRACIEMPARVSRIAVSKDARYCAVLFQRGVYADSEDEEKDAHDKVVETIDIYDLETCALALPGEQARLRLTASDGKAEYGPIDCMQLTSEHLFFERSQSGGQVRRWKQGTYDAELHFDLLWAWSADTDPYISVSLLSPNILACLTYVNDQIPIVSLSFYRLDQDGSTRLARFSLLGNGTAPAVNYVAAGAEIRPGEDGLIVIVVMGQVYLFSISTLVDILYPSAVESEASNDPESKSKDVDGVEGEVKEQETSNDDAGPSEEGEAASGSGNAETESEEPVALQTFTLDFPSEHMYTWNRTNIRDIWPAVSGWRCVFDFTQRAIEHSGEPGVLIFLDASPKHCSTHQADLSCHLSPTCTPLIYEHDLIKYLPPAVCKENVELVTDLKGGRLLLFAQPLPTEEEPGDPGYPYLFNWRL